MPPFVSQTLDASKLRRQIAPPPQFFQEFHYRFNAWIAYLGVFAHESTCLDTRLKDRPDVKDLIDQILGTLKRNLSDYVGAPLREGDSSVDLQQKQTYYSAIQRSVDRLERIGIIIRRSSTTGLYRKVIHFSQTKARRSFETFSLDIIKSMYPNAAESLQVLLSRSVFLRYARLHYKSEHQKKLEQDYQYLEMSESVSSRSEDQEMDNNSLPKNEPITMSAQHAIPRDSINEIEEEEVVPDNMPVSVSETAPSTLKETVEWPPAPSKKTLSILPRGKYYPKPPRKEYEKDLKRCDWCFECYRKTQFEDTKWWRRHVDKDLTPYLCISEDCDQMLHTNVEVLV
ncbi:hypothetical protein GGR58DRAFT_491896 [Xylaria digitata]|nr:hypothetical protein GGR58DRAFT_491896 [Xylaria digitata]